VCPSALVAAVVGCARTRGPGGVIPRTFRMEQNFPTGGGGNFAWEPGGYGCGGAVGFQERPGRIKHTRFSVRVDWGRSFFLLRFSEVFFDTTADVTLKSK